MNLYLQYIVETWDFCQSTFYVLL